MIVITFALPTESRDLVALLRDRKRTSIGNGEAVTGKLASRETLIFHTGVGPKVSASRIASLLDAQPFDLLISAGFAGSVSENFRIADLLLGENFSDPKLFANAQRQLAGRGARPGALFTAPSIVDSIEERNRVARTAGAMAVDMETEAIAKACGSRSIPMLSLRVISDSLKDPLPTPPQVLFDIERQQTNYIRLIGYLARHPLTIRHLVHFGRQISRAREALTNGIIDLVRQMTD